jgi:hypothetical protein
MPPVDMSAKAVTARLKLVSELRELCLLLGTAKIEPKPPTKRRPGRKRELSRQKNSK